MSRLLVVLSRGAQLEGVVADAQREEGDARVFYRDGAEVARAGAGERVVVRDLGAVHRGRPPFPRQAWGPRLAAAIR